MGALVNIFLSYFSQYSVVNVVLRNQPHVYAELHRYGLHKNLKTSSGTISPERNFYRPAYGPLQETNAEELDTAAQRAADAFFAINGLTSRELMPYPHEPFRNPVPWLKYDHLSAKDRLDQLDIPQFEKDVFDTLISSFGSVPGSECGFTEVLRWYALGGHSMAGVFELAGTYKLGNGGMTSFANAILSDYKGHLLFNTVIKKITQGSGGAVLCVENGRQIRCKYVISTIPL
jgi:Flavin containing amine oxidoreductase